MVWEIVVKLMCVEKSYAVFMALSTGKKDLLEICCTIHFLNF
jgi:hypothetical protein